MVLAREHFGSICHFQNLTMPTSIQQEAFLFSHAIGQRLPQVSDRLMELMLLEPQGLLEPETLDVEVVVLLQSVLELTAASSREAHIPSTDNRKKLIIQLLQHLSIDCMMPFSLLPPYVKKYAGGT
jgi:hypothetical protein